MDRHGTHVAQVHGISAVDREGSVAGAFEKGLWGTFDYPEGSVVMMLFVNDLLNGLPAAVVPFFPDVPVLSGAASIGHTRNAYSSGSHVAGKVFEADALKYDA